MSGSDRGSCSGSVTEVKAKEKPTKTPMGGSDRGSCSGSKAEVKAKENMEAVTKVGVQLRRGSGSIS